MSIAREMLCLSGHLTEKEYTPLLVQTTSINSSIPQPVESIASICGFSDFPLDILQYIFQLTLPADSEPTLDMTMAPLLLCCVSPTWRSIALGTPELWTSLRVLVEHSKLNDGETRKNYAAAVNEWFSRTKEGQLLAYRFFLRVHHEAAQDPEMDKFSRDIFLPHLSRCRMLDVGADTESVLHPFYSHPPGSVGQVESLVLRVPHLQRADDVDFTVFQEAPLLRKASLASVAREFQFMLPWKQLTHLTALDVSISTWKKLMRAVPLLQEAVFYILDISDTDEECPEVTLPHLKSLALTAAGEMDASIFNNLHFPALTSIEGHGMIGCDVNPSSNTDSKDFLRVVSSLTRIVVDHFSIHTPEMIQLLELSNSTLETLEVSGDFDFRLLFDKINCRDAEGNYKTDIFLPRLSTLILDFPALSHNDEEVDFPYGAFVKMITSRCWMGTPNPTPPIARLRILKLSSPLKQLFPELTKAIELVEGDDISVSFFVRTAQRQRFTYRYQELKHW